MWKSDGKLSLVQAQFSQMRPVAMTPSVAPRMPMYPPGGPGLGQQIFYGQGPPAIIPSQVTFSLDCSILSRAVYFSFSLLLVWLVLLPYILV